MTYTVIVVPKAKKYLLSLDDKTFDSIELHIEELRKNPYRKRPLVDIKRLEGYRSPPMYRLRVGRHRMEYFIEEDEKVIYIVDVFLRTRDSDYR